jgi:hypothetical protein
VDDGVHVNRQGGDVTGSRSDDSDAGIVLDVLAKKPVNPHCLTAFKEEEKRKEGFIQTVF